MTLYDLIMGKGIGTFNKEDWARLGRGEVTDEDTIKEMLAEGYGAIADDE